MFVSVLLLKILSILVVKLKKDAVKGFKGTLTKKYKVVLKTESLKKDIVELSNQHISEDLLKWQSNLDIDSINLININ